MLRVRSPFSLLAPRNRSPSNLVNKILSKTSSIPDPKPSQPKLTPETLLSDAGKASAPFTTSFKPGASGFEVPTRFRLSTDRSLPSKETLTDPLADNASSTYTDFVGQRFPTLETGENFRYWRERGLAKLAPKIFPIHVSTKHRIHPLMRFYLQWLHRTDCGRFSVNRLAERYALQPRTVVQILGRAGREAWAREHGLGGRKFRQETKDERIASAKERVFAKKTGGYEVLGHQDVEDERETIGEEFHGPKATSDFIRLQQIEVENFSSFPMPNKRNPVPKRVDVDVLVRRDADKKIVNWIDPNDKVVF